MCSAPGTEGEKTMERTPQVILVEELAQRVAVLEHKLGLVHEEDSIAPDKPIATVSSAAVRPATSRRGALRTLLGTGSALVGAGALIGTQAGHAVAAVAGSFASSEAGTPAVRAVGHNKAPGI